MLETGNRLINAIVGKYEVGLPLGYQTWPGKYLKVDDVPVDGDLQLAA